MRDLPLVVLLVLVFGYFAHWAPGFLDKINLASIGRDTAVIGMMGMGPWSSSRAALIFRARPFWRFRPA